MKSVADEWVEKQGNRIQHEDGWKLGDTPQTWGVWLVIPPKTEQTPRQ